MIVGFYDLRLVALSVVIAIFASYAALDFAGRVTSSRGLARKAWLSGGGAAMGIGIWSMHYVGMLAFRLPVSVEYDWPTVLASLLAAILASGFALFVVSRNEMRAIQLAGGSLLMGGGIASMHYIGMAAMRLPAACHYSRKLVSISIILAVLISFVALWLTFRLREETAGHSGKKLWSALVMGTAVPVMHYTGMASATFTPGPSMENSLSHAISISSLGTIGIIIVTFMVLGLAIITSLVDRRFSAKARELASTERRSRQILEMSFDAFVGLDSEGRVTDWNLQAETLLGWTRKEVMGRILSETIIPGRLRETYNRTIGQLFPSVQSSGQAIRFEIVICHKGGNEIPAEITISAICENQLHHFAAFVRDLRALRHAEEKLLSSIKELEDFKSALDQHCIVARTDHRGIITFANDRFCSISKYKREELIGRDHRMINSKYHPKEFIKDLWATIMAGRPWKGEIKNRAKDGTEYWVDTTIVPFRNSDGKIHQYIAIRTDISFIKRIQEELLKAKDLAESASRSKSEFLANMSHEIRTPMNGIIGISDLLAQTKLDPEQLGYVEMVSTSAHSLLTVLNDILDFSKIESGKLDFNSTPVLLRQSLTKTLKMFAAQASKKGIELTLLVADEVPLALMADELRLRQVLNNLVGNALKFTDSGEIAVRVSLDSMHDGKSVLHFEVSDTGIGIAPDKLKLIFDPFSQADSSTTRKYGGTGLGLTISTRLIQMMGGRMSVESRLGEGSTFHFLASFEHASLMTPEGNEDDPRVLRDLTALIVDDNATNRIVLEKMLMRWGVRTQSAASGREGLEALYSANAEGEPFSLLVVDGQMPEMDGFQMVHQLRDDSNFDPLGIVMLTSAGALGDGDRCRELRVRSFLTKPVDSDMLKEAVLRAVGHISDKPVSVKPQAPTPVARGTSFKILLAEDNPVNQVVATRHLQKLGHSVEIVSNGRQAVEAFERGGFALILMDVQMPELNGYDATAEIRNKEAGTATTTPIIAMTAHAMVGDREKCLAAGMDGYVSKPIQIDTLAAEISSVLERVPKTPTRSPRTETPPTVNAHNLATLMDGDLDLLGTSIDIFRTEKPKLLAKIRDAVEGRHAIYLEEAAHALKGMLKGLAAERAASIAQRLESMGRAAQFEKSLCVLVSLDAELERFDCALAEILKQARAANSLSVL